MAQISIVIPYYNESQSIVKTLELIESQTVRPIKVFLVNSSSRDDSSEKIENWIAAKPGRSSLFQNVFAGSDNPGSSKNVGIGLSVTQWVAFMDCGLEFSSDWLEGQVSYLDRDPSVRWVSGVGEFSGVGVIDHCATTQTYGTMVNRLNIPSSLISRSAFDQVGPFASKRAGYDVDWAARAERVGISKHTNSAVRVRYFGVSFANTLYGVWRKGFTYAKASVGILGYRRPYRVFIICASGILLVALAPGIRVELIAAYVLLRGIAIPTYKCKDLTWTKRNPLMIAPMFVVGAILDISRFLGLLAGICARTVGGLRKIADRIVSRRRP